jgi:hypothetical protein
MPSLGEVGWKATAKWFTTEGSPSIGRPNGGIPFYISVPGSLDPRKRVRLG